MVEFFRSYLFLIEIILLTSSIITFWIVQTSLGYRLIYILTMSIFTYYLLQLLHDHHEFSLLFSFFLSPNLLIVTATIIYWMILAEITKQRTRIFFTACFFTVLALTFIFMLPLLHVGYSFLLGSFIIFTANQTEQWLYQAPDLLKLILALTIPLVFFLLVINKETAIFCGFLIGTGIGYQLEQIKVRMVIPTKIQKKLLSTIIGLTGILVIIGTLFYIKAYSITFIFLQSLLLGLWVTWFAPFLFVKLNIFTHVKGHFPHNK